MPAKKFVLPILLTTLCSGAAALSRFGISGRKPLCRTPSEVAEPIRYELHAGHQPGFLFYTDTG